MRPKSPRKLLPIDLAHPYTPQEFRHSIIFVKVNPQGKITSDVMLKLGHKEKGDADKQDS